MTRPLIPEHPTPNPQLQTPDPGAPDPRSSTSRPLIPELRTPDPEHETPLPRAGDLPLPLLGPQFAFDDAISTRRLHRPRSRAARR